MALLAALVILTTFAALGNPLATGTANAQDFDNSRIADCGLAELGTTRQTGWDQPGECVKSVQRWVAQAGGYFGYGGTISGYTNSGAVRISAVEARKGDIIQWTNGNDGDWSCPHTACIVRNNKDGTFWVVHSNWDAKGLVSQTKRWDPNPESIGRAGWYPMYWRFGNPPAIGGGHNVLGAIAPAPTFYFAEGTCRPGFTPYFCIQNPGASPAEVTLTYMKGDSTTEKQSARVPPRSRLTVAPKDTLGEGYDAAHDFSTTVACTNGQLIVAERPTYFDFEGWTDGSNVVGATEPARTLYFAEGTCRPGFDTYFCVQNPGGSPTTVELTYMKGDGTSSQQRRVIRPRSRATFHPADVLGTGDDTAHDFSTTIECLDGAGIVAERPTYFEFRGWSGGHDVMGSSTRASTFYFAEGTCRKGFTPYFCIQNPGASTAAVTVSYMKSDGTADMQLVEVGKASRLTVAPKDRIGEGDGAAYDFSTSVACTNGQKIVVERPMYFDYRGCTGGSNVAGANSPSDVFYFAEGTCRNDFDTYICIQNPGTAAARVCITYMRGDGRAEEQCLTVAAGSRVTMSPEGFLGAGDGEAADFSTKVECTNGQRIVVERPMFFHILSED